LVEVAAKPIDYSIFGMLRSVTKNRNRKTQGSYSTSPRQQKRQIKTPDFVSVFLLAENQGFLSAFCLPVYFELFHL